MYCFKNKHLANYNKHRYMNSCRGLIGNYCHHLQGTYWKPLPSSAGDLLETTAIICRGLTRNYCHHLQGTYSKLLPSSAGDLLETTAIICRGLTRNYCHHLQGTYSKLLSSSAEPHSFRSDSANIVVASFCFLTFGIV